jgi:aerobic carbon-monoxide dehydrogenase medium subunit
VKAASFDYARPRTLEEAVQILSQAPAAKLIAGGQTLGPMLNLRLVQPSLLVDVTRIPALVRVEEDGDAIILGACITHAAIEDGLIKDDPSKGFLADVAHGIAYRAVRTRGTIGGSIAHADPAADWLSCLTALGADVLITGPNGSRRLAVGDVVRSPMTTDMAHDEILDGVRIPKLSRGASAGFAKICRKVGEFAEAIGVVVRDAERGVLRLVAGATRGRPILIDGTRAGLAAAWPPKLDGRALRENLCQAGFVGDDYELNIQVAAMSRALEKAIAR